MADSASQRAAALEHVDTVYSKRRGEKLCSLRVLCHAWVVGYSLENYQEMVQFFISMFLTLLVRGGHIVPPSTKYRLKSGYLGARTPQTH